MPANVIQVDFRTPRGLSPLLPGEKSATVYVLRPERCNAAEAYELYCQASDLDEDRDTMARAEALYRRAIACDPALSMAYTNLGNIAWRLRGDRGAASALYRQAILVDSSQWEGHYNLGYMMLEGDQPERAVGLFERVIALDATNADAVYNLATAFEQLRDPARAWQQWTRFLTLQPTGEWADLAREGQHRCRPNLSIAKTPPPRKRRKAKPTREAS